MGKVTVLLFGAITEIVGKNTLTVDGLSSTDALKQQLEKEYPALRRLSYSIAVNKKIISTTAALEDGATVALLPPFSGG